MAVCGLRSKADLIFRSWHISDQRVFLYMPYQHSEDRDDQARGIALYAMLGKPANLDFALRHQAVVDRFDRFPHRNALLGRASTEEERSFLTEPGSSF